MSITTLRYFILFFVIIKINLSRLWPKFLSLIKASMHHSAFASVCVWRCKKWAQYVFQSTMLMPHFLYASFNVRDSAVQPRVIENKASLVCSRDRNAIKTMRNEMWKQQSLLLKMAVWNRVSSSINFKPGNTAILIVLYANLNTTFQLLKIGNYFKPPKCSISFQLVECYRLMQSWASRLTKRRIKFWLHS